MPPLVHGVAPGRASDSMRRRPACVDQAMIDDAAGHPDRSAGYTPLRRRDIGSSNVKTSTLAVHISIWRGHQARLERKGVLFGATGTVAAQTPGRVVRANIPGVQGWQWGIRTSWTNRLHVRPPTPRYYCAEGRRHYYLIFSLGGVLLFFIIGISMDCF